MKMRSNKDFEFHQNQRSAVWRMNKSSHLTGNAPGVTYELLDAISNVRHLHEMVFIKPTDVSFVEMVGDRDDSFAFELGWLPGMDEVACSIAALFTLACEIGANLLRHNLWEDIR